MTNPWQRIRLWVHTLFQNMPQGVKKLLTILLWPFLPLVAVWRYLGKLGLALRNLLRWAFFPLNWSAQLLWPYFRPAWRYLGKLGLALRRLLTAVLRFIFWPLIILLTWGKHRWLAYWERTKPQRKRRRRHWASWWAVRLARLKQALRRRKAPQNAIFAPAVYIPTTPRRTPSFLATFVTVNVAILAFSYLFMQFAPEEVKPDMLLAAVGEPTRPLTPTPTLTPSPTATPTITPTPTPATIALTPWPTPDPLSSGGSVAFTLHQNGNSDIYVLSIGQAAPVRLTNDPAVDRDPAWSPDGRSLAFTSHRDGNWEIYVLDLTSGKVDRITADVGFDGGPSWSPDGQWLVYEAYRNNNLDIYITKRDGSQGPIRLTENSAPDFEPIWSPDGRHIAFTSWRSGNKDIFLMSLDNVGDDKALNITQSPNRFEDAAAFSPDGRYLAYSDNSSGFDLVYAQALNNYRPAGNPVSLGQGKQPTFSPNGQSLAYVHQIGSQNFLIASSVDAWAVAPQTYAADGRIEDPAWSAIQLVEKPAGFMAAIAGTQDVPLYTETLTRHTDGAPYRLLELRVDAPLPYLSDTVEQSFLALAQRQAAETGWNLFAQVDKLYEPISAKPVPSQSSRTWHKAGRAFDLNYAAALAFNPQIEVAREDLGNETFWRVYLLTAAQDGSQGEPLRDLPWDFRARYGADPRYYDQGGAWKERVPAGYFVDFTALAADYGWQRVAAAENWRTYFPGIRFWQFENRGGLTWEEAMAEIYTVQEILSEFGQR